MVSHARNLAHVAAVGTDETINFIKSPRGGAKRLKIASRDGDGDLKNVEPKKLSTSCIDQSKGASKNKKPVRGRKGGQFRAMKVGRRKEKRNLVREIHSELTLE
jgi:hypothetical protein